MNTSFNFIINKEISVSDALDDTCSVTEKKVILNGPASRNSLSNDLVQMITIMDCTKAEFNKIKRKAPLKTLFKLKVAY